MKRIPSLDGLRAVSIAMVLLAHTALSSGYESWWLHTYAHAGVLIFFILSGYLITTLMLREVEQTGTLNVRSFYLRRAWRLFPVVYLYLIIVSLAQHRQFSWSDLGLTWGYLASYGMCFEGFPWNFSHLWSLSVEEQFYLLWPLVVAASLPWSKRAAWAAVLLGPLCRYFFAHLGWYRAIHFSFPGVVDSVATGCLIAFYARRLTSVVSHFRWAGVIWLVAIASPLLLLIGNQTRVLWPLPQLLSHCAWTLFNISVGVGILWAIAARPKVLNHWFPVWVGTISYSLYIWQMPFTNPAAQIPFPANLLMALLAAVASYYLLEEPMLRLRKQFLRGQGRRGQGRLGRMANTQAVILSTAPEN